MHIPFNTKSRLRKHYIIALTVGFAVILVTFSILSPVAKYLLEKYDKDLFARELKMDWAYVNPFTGFIHLENLKMYEATGDSIFISTKSVHGNINLFKLFLRSVEIKHLTLEWPKGKIVQTNKVFSIDDLIEKFSPNDSSHSRWKVDLLGFKIEDGEFHFVDKIIPINYFIKNVNMECLSNFTQTDTLASTFSFLAGIGNGEMKGDFTINTKTKDYRFAVIADDFDMEIIRQYIWELINYGMFTAHVDADLRGSGNFSSREHITAEGRFSVRDFHLGKTVEDDYLAFKKLVVVMEELSPANGIFLLDTVLLSSPFIKYERYDSLDNVETLFGKGGKNISDITLQPGRFNLVIEIARYVKVLSTRFFKSNYKVNTLRVDDGNFEFNDFSISEEFSMQVSPLSIHADSVNKQERVEVSIQSNIKPYGTGAVQLSINPKDSGDFDMHYRLRKIPASVFNPYLITYSSFPLDRGVMELTGDWKVRNGIIESNNHLLIVDPRVSIRVHNKDMKWLPMPFIMALIREKGNVIDYDIPITGDLKNPKFHLVDAIFDLVQNIFIKPPTIPYRMEVKYLESEIEQSNTIQWEIRQRTLRPEQIKYIKHISRFFKDEGTASMSVYPITFADREKEQILFFETKKKYFKLVHQLDDKSFSETDSIKVENMSIKDKALVNHISKHLSDTVMFTLQEKCINFIGNQLVKERFNQLLAERERLFLSYFKANGTEGRVSIHKNKNEIPYNGFSYFQLDYGKGIPKSLQEAYQKMNKLNKERSRKKYIKYREGQI